MECSIFHLMQLLTVGILTWWIKTCLFFFFNYCISITVDMGSIWSLVLCCESPRTQYNPPISSSVETVSKWPGTAAKGTVVQIWPIIKSVWFSLIFAQAVIMVDCGLAEHRLGLLIHPGTWHLLDWWSNYQDGVYCASVIYNVLLRRREGGPSAQRGKLDFAKIIWHTVLCPVQIMWKQLPTNLHFLFYFNIIICDILISVQDRTSPLRLNQMLRD